MKNLLLSSALLTLASTASAEIYKFDAGHTEVRFYYNHAGVAEQSGEWGMIDGEVDFDPENIGATKVNVRIDPKSINTGLEGLDNHLKSADFFDVENHPSITFTSTSVEQTGENTAKVIGDLNIKGTAKPLTMTFTLTHNGAHPMGGFMDHFKGQWIGVSGTGTLKRSDYGVDQFVPAVSDEVRIEIATEMRAGGWE